MMQAMPMQMGPSSSASQSNSHAEQQQQQSTALPPSFGLGVSDSMFSTSPHLIDGQVFPTTGQNISLPTVSSGFPPNMQGQGPVDMGIDQFWSERVSVWTWVPEAGPGTGSY